MCNPIVEIDDDLRVLKINGVSSKSGLRLQVQCDQALHDKGCYPVVFKKQTNITRFAFRKIIPSLCKMS